MTARAVKHPFKYDRDANRVFLDEFEPTRTKQAFAEECDINRIMDKFHKTGVLTHLSKYGDVFGIDTQADLLDAMLTVKRANEMYLELPSQVRRQFDGPEDFVGFCEREENIDKLREWGLAKTPEEQKAILVRMDKKEPGQPPTSEDPAPE